jgi:WD40 repeat protein
MRRFAVSLLGPGFRAFALSPDGAVLATAWGTETIRLFDAVTGKISREFPARGPACFVGFGSDGTTLTSVGADRILEVWDVVAGKETRRLRLGALNTGGHPGLLRSGDRRLIAGPADGDAVGIWDTATGKLVRQLERRFCAGGFAFSPDGKTFAAIPAGEDRLTIGLFDIGTGREKFLYPRHQGGISALAFPPRDRVIASAGEDGTIRFWDVATGKEVRRIIGARVQSFAYSLDGRRIATWNNDDSFGLRDVGSGKEARRVRGNYAGPMSAVAFARDGTIVAAAPEDDDVVTFWDTTTGREIRRRSLHHTGSISSLSFRPDGKAIALSGTDGSVELWEISGFRRLGRIDASQGPVFSIDIAPDGKTVCIGGADAVLRLWKPETGEVRESAAREHPSQHMIHSVAFAPDGNRVAWSGISDGIVRIWDVKVGREIGQFPGQRLGVSLVVFSPNSRLVASANGDGTILVWDLSELNR